MSLILIAEDEYLLAIMLKEFLEEEGFEVELAANGRVALERARDRIPDLIVTDFMMPALSGLELAEAARSDPQLRQVPVILVSGAQASIGRMRGDLFDAVLDKPYHHADLLRLIVRALESARTQQIRGSLC